MAEGERKRLRKITALAWLPAHRVCFLGSDWQGNRHPFLETDTGNCSQVRTSCIQVALVCMAMPTLFGSLKTHSFTLPGFTLRTCSTLLLLKWTLSQQLLARKKISSVPCQRVLLTHFVEVSAAWRTGGPSETNSESRVPLAGASQGCCCGCF